MSRYTYNELVAALQSWPEDDNPEYIDEIPRIISLGESRLVKDLNLEVFDPIVDDIPVDEGSNTVTKPEDWVSTRSIWVVDEGRKLLLHKRSLEWCNELDMSCTMRPQFFAEVDEQTWFVVPTPDKGYTVEARVIMRPDGLSENKAETYFSRNWGDLLLAACLMEAEVYLKGDERWVTMRQRYFEELLPIARLETRNIQRADYSPVKRAAEAV